MATNEGWWDLELKDNTMDELTDKDKENIANLIKKGFTSGNVVQDEEQE